MKEEGKEKMLMHLKNTQKIKLTSKYNGAFSS